MAHQGLAGWLRDPEAVVSVELGQPAAARQAQRLQLVVRLKQKTQGQRVSLGVQEVCEDPGQICHDALSCVGERGLLGPSVTPTPTRIRGPERFITTLRNHTTSLEGEATTADHTRLLLKHTAHSQTAGAEAQKWETQDQKR